MTKIRFCATVYPIFEKEKEKREKGRKPEIGDCDFP